MFGTSSLKHLVDLISIVTNHVTHHCYTKLLMQEGLRTLLTRHALSSATLDDVLLALLNGFATSVETTRSGSFLCLMLHQVVACHIMPVCHAQLLGLGLLDTLAESLLAV